MKFYTAFLLLWSIQVVAQKSDSKQITVKEGTNVAIVLSPDGQTIAINLHGTIYLISSARGNAIPLTDGMGDDRQPCWSLDRQRVVF